MPSVPVHVFVDEVKERGYVVVAASFPAAQVRTARQAIRALIMPNQKRVHFYKEGDARRKQIIGVISDLGPFVTIYRTSAVDRAHQRNACLSQLVADLAKDSTLLVLEQDDSLLENDRRTLYRRAREHACEDTLIYRHLRASAEPLLTVPDALAWCWNRGGHWGKLIARQVGDVVDLDQR
nr:hypothetical protein [Herbihabitans rhizosphaerae]